MMGNPRPNPFITLGKKARGYPIGDKSWLPFDVLKYKLSTPRASAAKSGLAGLKAGSWPKGADDARGTKLSTGSIQA
jgi:hypothetical protein